jgi:hypothetical protein
MPLVTTLRVTFILCVFGVIHIGSEICMDVVFEGSKICNKIHTNLELAL